MTIVVGGLRDRLIHESVYRRVQSGLEAIGWMNSGRSHAPLVLIPEQKSWDEELAPNSITVAPADTDDEDWELGSFGSKNTHVFNVDVFGENEALGLQISGDVRDIIRGKFSTQFTNQAQLPVLDWTQGTTSPPTLFMCDIEHVTRDRALNFPHKFQRYLWVIRFEVIDYYTSDADVTYYGELP